MLDTLLPIMQKIETTIDKIGDDFGVQKFDPAEYALSPARMTTPKPLTSRFVFVFLFAAAQSGQPSEAALRFKLLG